MKKSALSFIVLGIIVAVSGCKTGPGSKAAAAKTNAADILNTEKARDSYALGMFFGHDVKRAGVDIDSDLMARGIKDFLAGTNTLLTSDQMMAAMNNLRQQAMADRQKMMQEESQSNQVEGAQFLSQNKTKPGVMTLPDGLQYKIITQASGENPDPNDIVTVNYRGTFIDGTEFDSSAKAGHPAEFPVRAVIPGWTEALQKMTVGSKWQLFVPGNLAYGPGGHPPVIGPNKTLVFDVELLSIQHPPPVTPHQPLTSDIIKVPSAEEMKNGAKIETIKASDVQKMQQQQNSTN